LAVETQSELKLCAIRFVERDVHRDLLSTRTAAASLSRDFGATSGRAAVKFSNVITELCIRNDAKKMGLGLSFLLFLFHNFYGDAARHLFPRKTQRIRQCERRHGRRAPGVASMATRNDGERTEETTTTGKLPPAEEPRRVIEEYIEVLKKLRRLLS
jgi:hypothetical protein